eukprot:GHVT01043544.1.p1 GENE.GHVT01043544.1~~GHVT01043544.1.p1  ORF type:complete len:195 (-),score=56.64 GHVT01043544.1:1190-1774(-)
MAFVICWSAQAVTSGRESGAEGLLASGGCSIAPWEGAGPEDRASGEHAARRDSQARQRSMLDGQREQQRLKKEREAARAEADALADAEAGREAIKYLDAVAAEDARRSKQAATAMANFQHQQHALKLAKERQEAADAHEANAWTLRQIAREDQQFVKYANQCIQQGNTQGKNTIPMKKSLNKIVKHQPKKETHK